MYKENPKTKGSGIMCAIPQTGRCPQKCDDCFFQSGRSYLEPLNKNLPNLPGLDDLAGHIVRINDGNDSNVDRLDVEAYAARLDEIGVGHFFNTSIPTRLDEFPGPVVLTVNPGKKTDLDFYEFDIIPRNLMFVRFRANTWNRQLLRKCVEYYTSRDVPVVVTFMAYYNTPGKIPYTHQRNYMYRKRTLNSYYAITTRAAEEIMWHFKYNKLVYQCGKVEGERGDTHCRYCGNCLREYFATMERMNENRDGI